MAVLCKQSIDALCHAALRARATGAFVANCADAAALDDIVARLAGQMVVVTVHGTDVAVAACDGSKLDSEGGSSGSQHRDADSAHARPAEVDLSEARCVPATCAG